VLGVVGGVWGVVVCQTRLKLSWKVNECKPLPYVTTNPAIRLLSIGGQGLQPSYLSCST